MEGPIKAGDVVIVNFPYIDVEGKYKPRPALVLATPSPFVCILAEITTSLLNRPHSIPLIESDFIEGQIQKPSRIRADVIFTLDIAQFKEKAGTVSETKLSEVLTALSTILYGEFH